MDNQRTVGDSSGPIAANSLPAEQYARPVKSEEQFSIGFQQGKANPTGAIQDPQQADLLQVMQDVTGRFIMNAATQLRKRAASLCYEELKEYKRSKKLNILTAPKEVEAAESRPPSASYLIPAVPHGGHPACPSEPSASHMPCCKRTASSEADHAASAAQDGLKSNFTASIHPQSACPTHCANEAAAHTSMPDLHEAAHSKQPASHPSVTAGLSYHVQGSLPKQQALGRTQDSGASATHQSCLHEPAPAKPVSCPVRPHTDRQHWLHLPKQHGPLPSWSQNGSQLVHQWDHGSPEEFAQAKLTCTPNFPFSKQPCAVMW